MEVSASPWEQVSALQSAEGWAWASEQVSVLATVSAWALGEEWRWAPVEEWQSAPATGSASVLEPATGWVWALGEEWRWAPESALGLAVASEWQSAEGSTLEQEQELVLPLESVSALASATTVDQ